MKSLPLIPILVLLLSVAPTAHPALADDAPSEQLAVEVPPAVKKSISAELGDGKLIGLSLEYDKDNDNKPYYEAKAIVQNEKYTIQVEPDGKLLSKFAEAADPAPEKVAPGDLPDPVKATLQKEAGNVAPHDVTRQDKQAVYELRVLINGHHYTIKIDAAGKLISKDLTDPDDDDTGGKGAA